MKKKSVQCKIEFLRQQFKHAFDQYTALLPRKDTAAGTSLAAVRQKILILGQQIQAIRNS